MKKLFLTVITVHASEEILTKEYYKAHVESVKGLNPFLKKAHEWVNEGDVEYQKLTNK